MSLTCFHAFLASSSHTLRQSSNMRSGEAGSAQAAQVIIYERSCLRKHGRWQRHRGKEAAGSAAAGAYLYAMPPDAPCCSCGYRLGVSPGTECRGYPPCGGAPWAGRPAPRRRSLPPPLSAAAATSWRAAWSRAVCQTATPQVCGEPMRPDGGKQMGGAGRRGTQPRRVQLLLCTDRTEIT